MKESDIRNRSVFNAYCDLVKKDSDTYFKPGEFIGIKCPACGSGKHLFEFRKNKFRYVSCEKCSTLFVNPRPSRAMIGEFYSKSPSARFWINDFFKPVAEMRREKIFKPRAERLSKMMPWNEKCVIGDIGSGFGIFLEEMRKIMPGNRYIAIEPSPEMASICRDKNLEAKCAGLEDISGMDNGFDVLTGFELIEHLFSPGAFFKKVYSLLKPGGSFIMTALNGMGFDILLLWERSKSVMPPHHLNFFNPDSIRQPLEKAGFEITEVSTPGRLDWDIVEGMIRGEGLRVNRFWNFLADKTAPDCKKKLQAWISENNLSSHMQVIAKKPPA